MPARSQSIRYADAGVDRTRADAVKDRIQKLARSTFTRQVLAGIGGFGALYALERRGRQPVLVSSVDGVGTKLKVAAQVGAYQVVGADIVHHCVNDIAVQGAAPLFFLDYIASSRLDPAALEQVLRGMIRACRALRVALIGGETAEMPGVYAPGEMDVVGCIVGVVERSKILPGRVRPGDRLIGLASTGLHTNGYSLARKLCFEVAGLAPRSHVPELHSTVAGALLQPHRCYYPVLKPLLEKGWLNAAAHITGGGLTENLPRVLPRNCAAEVHLDWWLVPPLFRWLERLGGVSAGEMLRTFNMGIGMVLVVSPRLQSKVERVLRRHRMKFHQIGEVVRLSRRGREGRQPVRYGGGWR